MKKILFSRFKTFSKENQGSATIESVLWLPMFLAAFALMTDVAMIFNGHSRVLRVVQDANRNLSIGRLDTEDETEEYIVAALSTLAPNLTADTSIVAGVATSTAVVPASDLQILGMFSAISTMNISVTSQHLIEF
ncbi:MAG: pilus assembly protein [Marinosulfonomonas sp.]|nr:pilus assembly protein [Marinosulfonomonas sp.]